MADLTSNLIVRLIDRVSGPASAAGRAIRGMRQSVAGAGGAIATAQANVRAAIDTNAQRMDAMRGRMFDAAAGAYVLTKAISAPIRAAMDFESAMADVRKVVDFDSPAAFKQFQTDIISMSKRIPLAAKDLTAIVAAAGQAGIPRDELLRFTEMAAKVGVAFEISADQAGESLAKMMTGLGLSITEVSALADAMNHLSDSQASSAADILDVVRRVGATAKQYGFAAEEVSAFASAMLAAGAESNVAATSFRNMGKALTKGASATKGQYAAFQTLGLEAEDVARRMQEDAVGTTIDVLERIGKLPAEMQAAVSSDLFGDEARALGPLLTNLDLLRKSLGLVADKSKYLGSAQREYDRRAETSANAFQLFKNNITALNIAIGNTLIPGLNKLFAALTPIINAFETLATDFPGLTSSVISLVAGLVGLRIAALGAGYGGLLLRGGFLNAIMPALGLAKGMTRVTAALGRAVPRVRLFGKVMKSVPEATAATAAGMSLVDQSMTKAVKSSKKASDAMVLGMSATRVAQAQASRSMIAGMSAVTAASVVPRRGFAAAFKGVGTAAAAAIAAPVAAALRGLPAIARVAARGIKIALLGTGIGAALVAIGAAAEWVRENWEGITVAIEAFSGEFGRSMKDVFPEGEPGFVKFIRGLIEDFDTLTGKIDPDNGKWAQWGIEAGKSAVALARDIQSVADAISNVVGWFTAFNDFDREFSANVDGMIAESISAFETWFNDLNAKGVALRDQMFAAGVDAIQGLWDGMSSKVDDLIDYVAKIPGMIIDAIGSIDLSNIIKWPSPPAWLGGAVGAGKAAPSVSGASEFPEAREKGGPVTGRRPYIVGEKRPELFVPSSSGSIRPKVPGGGFTYAPQVSLTVHEAAGDIRTAFAEFNRRLREDAEAAFRAHFGDDMETA
jgi:TP901 family phage tail tape measure protein